MIIDDELTGLVRHAAEAVPPSAPDLQAVYRRHRRHRNRTAVTTGAAALVVLTGAGLVLHSAGPDATSPSDASPAAPLAPPSPAPNAVTGPTVQVTSFGATLKDTNRGYQVPPGLVTVGGEHRVAVVALPSAVDSLRSWYPVPDGRAVLLGSRNLAPGTNRADGVDVTDLEINLVVVAPDGSTLMSRNVRHQGYDVELVGVTPATAYLWRTETGLVAHDLATATETPVATLTAATQRADATYSLQNGVLIVAAEAECTVKIYDVANGNLRQSVQLPATGPCPSAGQARVSPSGRLVALPVVLWNNPVRTELRSINLTTGRSTSTLISETDESTSAASGVLGLAWDDSNRSIRVAYPVLPNPVERMYPLADVLRFVDVPAQP